MPESVTIPISFISHISITSDLTLTAESDSICVVKLTFYLRGGESSEQLADHQDLKKQIQQTHIDDDEKAISELGGIKLSSFWFEKETIGGGSELPKTKDVVAEMKYWLNR
jgi:hypothetical protein